MRYWYDALGRRVAKESNAWVRQSSYDGSGYREAETARLNAENGYGMTLYGWGGDRLAWESGTGEYGGSGRTTHYVYEPDSFVPLAQAVHAGWIELHDQPEYDEHYDIDRDPLWSRTNKPRMFAQIGYYQCDQIGTPQEVTDEAGEVAWSVRYKAWGEAKEVIREAARKAGIRNPIRFQGQYFDHETGLHYNRHRYYDPNAGRFISTDPIGLAGGINVYQYAPNPVSWVDPLGLQPTVTGTTKGGLSRCSTEWRQRFGPAQIREHHLIPQAMLRDDDFTSQMKSVGIADPEDYIHRQIAQIPNAEHNSLHADGWNKDWQNWYSNNPNFTRKDLESQTKNMMRNYNIPKSSRNFSGRYGSRC
ncbi:Rhs family protein [Burkholderia paludis]|uniref:Rhs family protein n=1 Tax=Burkholderia paludis TaxID=1506587 RepID=A0A6J5F5W3_9BURK|nr:hypothetical protein LMG30113_07518 [Burkholderia paludis]VWC48347.1 Rhs family protein [Burkholderia paludis]